MAKAREYIEVYGKPLGLKESSPIGKAPDGSLYDSQNMYLSTQGKRLHRRGSIPYFSAPSKIDSFFDYTNENGDQFILTKFGADLSYKDGTGVHAPSLHTTFTADSRFEFTKYYDVCYMTSIVDGFWKFNGILFDRARLSPPSAIPVLALQAGGALIDTIVVKYYVTFYNSVTGWESNPFGLASAAPSITVTAPNLTVRVTMPALGAGETADNYRLYRTTKAVSGATLFRTKTLSYAVYNPNTGTGFYDDAGDADGTIELEYDNNIPPNDSPSVVNYFDRLVMIDGDKVVWSKNDGRANAFPTVNFQIIGGDGKQVQRLVKQGNLLLAVKDTGIWYVSGDPDTTTFQQYLVPGALNYDCVVAHPYGTVIAFTQLGFYRAKATNYNISDLRWEPYSSDIKTKLSSLYFIAGAESNIRSFAYGTDEMQHIYFGMPYNGQSNIREWFVYDVNSGQWFPYNIDFNVTCFADVFTGGKNRMALSDENGYVWLWDEPFAYADGSTRLAAFLNGLVTAGSGAATLKDNTRTGDTEWTIDEFKGMYVRKYSSTTFEEERRLITANGIDELTVTPVWTNNPAAGDYYKIGFIDSFCHEAWIDMKCSHILKRSRWLRPYIDQMSNGSVQITVYLTTVADPTTKTLSVSGVATWGPTGNFYWGDNWSGPFFKDARLRFPGSFRYMSVKFSNITAGAGNDPNAGAGDFFGVDGYKHCYQKLTDRTDQLA